MNNRGRTGVFVCMHPLYLLFFYLFPLTMELQYLRSKMVDDKPIDKGEDSDASSGANLSPFFS